MSTTPSWVGYLAAAVMLGLAAYCSGRIGLARRLERRNNHDDNVAHTLMGLGMAVMFVPRLSNKVPVAVGGAVFGLVAVYFLAKRLVAGRAGKVRGAAADDPACRTHTLMHAVMAGSMVYMYWLLSATRGADHTMMGGPPAGAGDPSLTLLLVVVLFGSAVLEVDAAVRFAGLRAGAAPVGAVVAGAGAGGAVGAPAGRPFLAPRLDSACHVVMCLVMGLMLVLMV